MSYQIDESELRSALNVVENIGDHVDKSVVSRYQKDMYGTDSRSIVDQWEDFLVNELRHILARIGFKGHLNREYGKEVDVRGIDTDIDWASFHSPWNQRLSISVNSPEVDLLIKGIKPNYDWLALTESQYEQSLTDGKLVGAAVIRFEGWGAGDFTMPGVNGINTLVVEEADSLGNKREKPYNLNDLKKKFESTDNYGEYAVYKIKKETDWIIDHNSPVNVTIIGLGEASMFDEYGDITHPEDFETDYLIRTNKLKTTNEYLP